MGLFDTFKVPSENGNVEVQSKSFDCSMRDFHIGDIVDPTHTGVTVLDEGGYYIIIHDGIFVYGLDKDCSETIYLQRLLLRMANEIN